LDSVAVERDRWKAEADRLGHEAANLSEKLSMIRAKGKRLVADRDRWEAEATMLAEQLAEVSGVNDAPADAAQDKFSAAKRAFARHFHPNDNSQEGRDKAMRTEIFKSFWPVLEEIEQGRPGG
jgi:hypothetical protein